MKAKLRAYKVHCDVDHYQYFLWDVPDDVNYSVYAALECEGKPIKKRWKPAPVYIYKPRHKRGDFMAVDMGSGGFSIAPGALEKVRKFAEMAGELLPVPYQDQLFMLLNITECFDCLDPDRTEWV